MSETENSFEGPSLAVLTMTLRQEIMAFEAVDFTVYHRLWRVFRLLSDQGFQEVALALHEKFHGNMGRQLSYLLRLTPHQLQQQIRLWSSPEHYGRAGFLPGHIVRSEHPKSFVHGGLERLRHLVATEDYFTAKEKEALREASLAQPEKALKDPRKYPEHMQRDADFWDLFYQLRSEPFFYYPTSIGSVEIFDYLVLKHYRYFEAVMGHLRPVPDYRVAFLLCELEIRTARNLSERVQEVISWARDPNKLADHLHAHIPKAKRVSEQFKLVSHAYERVVDLQGRRDAFASLIPVD